jgi:hypothetical protein
LHVVAKDLEVRMPQKVLDVRAGPGEKTVEANDVVTLRDQSFAEVGTEKAGTTGHKDT